MDTLNQILHLIKKSGISEIEFTQRVGLNKTAVTEWKNGKTKSYNRYISKISDVLNVSEDYLLNNNINLSDEEILLNAYRNANNDKRHLILQKVLEITNNND